MSESVWVIGAEAEDVRTHVERINPLIDGATPAWAPGAMMEVQPMPDDRGIQRVYKMRSKGFHNGSIVRAGDTVMLYDDEVSAHHELMPEPEPAPEPVPDTKSKK